MPAIFSTSRTIGYSENSVPSPNPTARVAPIRPVKMPAICGKVARTPKFTPAAASMMLLGPGVIELMKANQHSDTRVEGGRKVASITTSARERNKLPHRQRVRLRSYRSPFSGLTPALAKASETSRRSENRSVRRNQSAWLHRLRPAAHGGDAGAADIDQAQ